MLYDPFKKCRTGFVSNYNFQAVFYMFSRMKIIGRVMCAFIFLLSVSHAKESARADQILRERAKSFFSGDPAPKPTSEARVRLGRKLFFDQKLSETGKMSCASCHIPEKAYGDGRKTAIGKNGQKLPRKTMSLLNIAGDPLFFWDGRAKTLEDQVLQALQNKKEMSLSLKKAVEIVNADLAYRPLFTKAFPKEKTPIRAENVAKAIADFERSLISANAPFDRWLAGQDQALTPKQKRGLDLFTDKANCVACHLGANFSDGLLNDIGLPDKDLGRGLITKNKNDNHFFKTPGLRNITERAPYTHAGGLKDLRAVIEHYNTGGFSRGDTDIPPEEKQGEIVAFHNFTQPLNLTPSEIDDMIEFLKSLSGEYPKERE